MRAELDLLGQRVAAELDKDMASAERLLPVTGTIIRENSTFIVQIYNCWVSEGGPLVTHTYDNGKLISRQTFRTRDEILKTFTGLKAIDPQPANPFF